MIELDKEAMPQKTNLDALREMSAENIGEFFAKALTADYICEVCPASQLCMERHISQNGLVDLDEDSLPKCMENFVAWLNSPVEVKEDE